MAHQAVSELDEDVIVAAATTRLPRLPMEVASQICKEHKRPRGRPPKSGYPPPVHTSTPDTIVVNAVPEYGLLSPPPCAHILPRDFVLSHAHNPKKPNQKYYPADRFFGITAEVIDVIFAKQKAEYWNESDKAPTAKDIHDAREYLRTHHWPERWLTSIWDGEPLEREVMEENEKAPERRVAEENERALGREKNDKEVDNESTRLGSSSPQKRGSDGSEEDVASVRSKKKVRFSDVMDLLSASDDKAPEKPKEDEQVDSGQVKYDLVLLGF